MIPDDWRPVRRDDGELVGYLAPEPGSSELAVPTTLIGTTLGPPQDPEIAAKLLADRGLAALNRTWWCRLPTPLTGDSGGGSGTGVDVTVPEPAWTWRPVVMVEVSPARGRVRLAMAEPAELRVQVAVPVPVGALLRDRQPE